MEETYSVKKEELDIVVRYAAIATYKLWMSRFAIFLNIAILLGISSIIGQTSIVNPLMSLFFLAAYLISCRIVTLKKCLRKEAEHLEKVLFEARAKDEIDRMIDDVDCR